MRGVTVLKQGGKLDEDVRFSENIPVPQRTRGKILLRVLAVSFSPGDARVFSGKTAGIQTPPVFPYVPGGDVCGIVEDPDPSGPFKKGDRVISMFDGNGPWGGCAEFCLVSTKHTVPAPTTVSAMEASAIPSSALTAKLAADQFVKAGHRVLIIGGSGGVGSHLIQIAKHAGAAYVVAISTQDALCRRLGADKVVDYRSQDWRTMPEFTSNPFDVVFDLVGGPGAWAKTSTCAAIKKGSAGNYVATAQDNPWFELTSWVGVASFMLTPMARSAKAKMSRSVPRYTFFFGLIPEKGNLESVSRLVDEGHLKPVIDDRSPLPFTADGVKEALRITAARQGHGKLVIRVGNFQA